MTTQDYTNKANELSAKYKGTITVGFDYKNNPYLETTSFDKAKTLDQMSVAKGFKIGFNGLMA